MELDIINWLLGTSYGPYVTAGFAILGGIVMIASAIAPFTKTTKDDEAVNFLKGIVQRFSFIKPKA